jgi:hypothetical protein
MMRRALAAALLAAVGACASPRVVLREGPRSYTAESYGDVLERWTRSAHAYQLDGIDDHLAVTATYESWDFRWAYVVRYARDFMLSTEERRALLDQQLEASTREHAFYVTLQSPTRRYGELTRPSSAWRVLLINDRRQEVAPVAVELVRRPGALERTYFPHTNAWRQVYRIRFPRRVRVPGQGELDILSEGIRSFSLRFSGPLGHADIVWQVEAS